MARGRDCAPHGALRRSGTLAPPADAQRAARLQKTASRAASRAAVLLLLPLSISYLPSFFLPSSFIIFFLPDLLSHFYQNRNALLSKREPLFFMIEANQNFYHRSIFDRSFPLFLSHHGTLIEIMGSFYQKRTSY